MNVEIGQLWKVNGVTYRVESLTGPDCQYPIVMAEAARDACVNADLDAQLEALPAAWRGDALVLECYKPRRMQVELRWFDRSDIKRIESQVAP